MTGVRVLVGLAVAVAACRAANEHVAPPPPQSVAELDAPSPTIVVSAHEVLPVATPSARVPDPPPVMILPPPPIVAPLEIVPSALQDEVEPIEHVMRDNALEPLGDEAGELDHLPHTPHAYGMTFDVGVPDGATVGIVIHPVRSLAVSAGLSYNGISYGGRGGVTWTPLSGTFSPTLSADIGHFADGDANPLARLVTGNPMYSSPVLDRVGYDFANAHVGLAITRHRWAFFVRAGVSRVTGAIHGLSDLGSGKMVTFGSDPTVTLTTVSARLGVIFYFAK